MIVRSSMTSVVHAGAPDALAAVEITISFSGNAFSVTNARGRLSSPSGSWWTFLQNPRMYAMTSSISSSVSRSPNAGIICESALPFAPVTRDAATLVDLLSIPHIRTFRIVERLCGEKQRATKRHDNPNDKCARRSRQKPEEVSKQSRFADGIQVPCLLQCRNSVANRGRLVSHSPSAFLHFNDKKRILALPTFKNCQSALQSQRPRHLPTPPALARQCLCETHVYPSTERCGQSAA